MIIAVMSDFHIGLGARAKDLCPEPPSTPRKTHDKYEAKTEDSFRQKFVDFVKLKELKADYLALPGDLTDKATPREAQLASEFVAQAAAALGVPEDRILFSPGNHDVDWTSYDPTDDTGVRWGQRYDPIGHKGFIFNKIIEMGKGDVLGPPHFAAREFPDLLAISYNSASHDKPIAEHAVHYGLADPDHLSAIRDFLSRIDTSDRRVRLFLVHHHPVDFDNPVPKDPDFSLMKNAESLLALLHEFDFDLLIHGHLHHPRFETHTTKTYPHIAILCSGSLCAEIDTRWAGTVDNQFHILAVDGRNGSENRINGTLYSWTNNRCRGWIPSEEASSGIYHRIPFGSYVMPKDLDARVEPFISQWLKKHDYVLWKDVVVAFPDLEYLPLGSAIAAFKRIGVRLGRQQMYETLKDLILY